MQAADAFLKSPTADNFRAVYTPYFAPDAPKPVLVSMNVLSRVRDAARRVDEAEQLDLKDSNNNELEQMPNALHGAAQAFRPVFVCTLFLQCATLDFPLQRSLAAQMNTDTLVRFKASQLFERYIAQEPLLFAAPIATAARPPVRPIERRIEPSGFSSRSADSPSAAQLASVAGFPGVMGKLTRPLFSSGLASQDKGPPSVHPDAPAADAAGSIEIIAPTTHGQAASGHATPATLVDTATITPDTIALPGIPEQTRALLGTPSTPI